MMKGNIVKFSDVAQMKSAVLEQKIMSTINDYIDYCHDSDVVLSYGEVVGSLEIAKLSVVNRMYREG